MELNNIGFLPDDKLLEKSVIEQKPVSILYPKSSVSKGFEKLADNVLNDTSYKSSKSKGLSTLFSNLIKIKGK
jgi:flagellar biosynthesis protein FlhG